MCDFKPGDEVVCISPGGWLNPAPKWMFWTKTVRSRTAGPQKGDVGVVVNVGLTNHPEDGRELVMLKLDRWRPSWHNSACFRKVQRRDLGAWLKTTTKNTDKIDRSAREKVKA